MCMIIVCKSLEVLELSQVKVTDEGLSLLLHFKLPHLRELDLSYTQVTSKGLKLLPLGRYGTENHLLCYIPTIHLWIIDVAILCDL